MKFYASIRIDVRKIESLKKENQVYGTRVRTKVVKNKIAPPFKLAEFIITAEGIDNDEAILDAAIQEGIISKSGSFLRMNDKIIGQGKEQVKEEFHKNPKLRQTLISAITEKLTGKKKDAKTP